MNKEIEFKNRDYEKFFSYAKNWWDTFRKQYATYEKRLVKVYAENEEGKYIHVSSYILPLFNV